jgi:hypothetical protein
MLNNMAYTFRKFTFLTTTLLIVEINGGQSKYYLTPKACLKSYPIAVYKY